MKICEIFSGKSLKEDLSIDTPFDPCYFLWDSTFKGNVSQKLTPMLLYIVQKLSLLRIGSKEDVPIEDRNL